MIGFDLFRSMKYLCNANNFPLNQIFFCLNIFFENQINFIIWHKLHLNLAMGNSEFLSAITDKKISIDQSLLNSSSSKLREYYSSYKSICQSFSITISEFIQIFGHNQKAFQAFDPKKKGRIDAIEMFTGLIIFSSINYEQKIKFLFEIFDFNEEGWLSYEALTFLLINACNSTYKIFSLSQTVNSKQIEAFLNQYFYEESEIALEKFIKWSRRIQEIMIFFNIIQHDFEPYFQLKKIDKLKPDFSKEKCLQYKQQKNFLQFKGNVEFQRSGNVLHTFLSKKVIKDQTEKSIKTSKFQDPNSIFENEPKRGKGKDSALLKQEAKKIEKEVKESKKISKTKYKINFEFDKKFIEVLQSLVAPFEQKYNSQHPSVKNERRSVQKQVNFNFSNPDYEDEEQMEEDENNIDEQTFNPSLKWLYGINLSIPNPVKFLQTSDPKASNQILIYSLNHTIILYYHKINIQKHYIHHMNPISTFEISENKNYIASADFGEDFDIEFPQIHIWRIKDRKPILKWKNLQKGKIHKLAWSMKDRNIVSISYFEGKWALKIIDLQTQNVMLSTYIDESSIFVPRNLPDNKEKVPLSHPMQFIDLLECKKVKKSKSKFGSQASSYFVIYSYNSVSIIYPNDENEQNMNSSEQFGPSYREFSMVTKLLSESESFLSQVNKLNNLFGGNESKVQKTFPSLLCLLEYQSQKFIGVHNDKKIRIWDKNFEHYETFYSRRQSEKPFFQVLLHTVPLINTKTQGNKHKTHLIQKITHTSLLQKQDSRTIKQLYPQGQTGKNTKILVILDEEKIQLLNMNTKETKFIEIPDSLYNLMLIGLKLIETRKKETQFILVSLFGDVIRVLGVGPLLESLAGHRQQESNTVWNSKNNNSSSKSKSSGKINVPSTSRKQLFQQFKHSQNSNSEESSEHSHQRIGPVQQIQKKVTFKKYYQIFSLQKCKDYYFYEEYCLILADKLIYKINSDQKELTTLISFDHQLKAISGFGSYFALLTEHVPQYVFIMQNDQVYQKIKLAHHISTIKLIPTHLILCEQKFIQVYTKSYEKYLTGDSRRVPIEGSLPIDICSTQNPFKFIIITQEREVFHLEIKNNEFRYKKVKSSQMMSSQGYNSQGYGMSMMESYLEISYPHLNDSFSMIFYPQQKFLSIGMSNGDVRVWGDLKRVKDNKEACMEYYDLLSHQGPVKKMRLRFYESELQLVTVGEKDGMIATYNHFDYLIGDKEQPTSKQLVYYLEQQQKFNPYLDQIAFNDKQFTQSIPFNSDTFKHSISLLKDSQISIGMFDEPLQPWICDIIMKIVHPSTSNYESLSGQNQQSRANLISLEIDHVYGFLSERVRNSVGYVHHYGNANEYERRSFEQMRDGSESASESVNREGLGQTKKAVENKLAFANSTLLPLNQEHQNCKREVIYFIDRLIILFNPETRKERVYSFHKSEVSTFQIHPGKFLVCSAQKTISNPIIHIWHSQSLVLKKSIQTKHKGGSIFRIEFSREGTYVLTLAGHCEETTSSMMDKGAFLMTNTNYSSLGMNTNNASTRNTDGMSGGYNNLDYISVEVLEWKYSNSILYRVLLQEVIFAIKFNPYCETEICFGGRDSLKIYSFETGNLVIKENLDGFGQTITALVYSSALYGTDIESDIIVGTMDGNAALYICGKLIKIKKIHQGSINFISLNELFKYKTIVITGGQDSMVRIWDTKFNMLAALDVRHQLLLGKHLNQYTSYNFSAQSIDFFSCYPQKITQLLNQYVFLVGTRSGHILECKISSEYQGLKAIQDKKVSFVKEKLSLEVKVLITNNNFINGGTQFEICGSKLMVSYSINSTVLFLWNYRKNDLINFYKLKGCPSIVKYDQNSSRVFVGYFKHSQVQVYKVGEDHIAYQQQFSIKSDYYPDNIIFNQVNNCIAISLVLALTLTDNTNPSTSSCIQIYEYKDSLKTNQNGKKEYEQKWRIDHSNKKKGSVLSFGINSSVWMGFSSTGHQLLVLYSQKRIHLGHHTSTNNQFLKDQPFALRDTYLPETLISAQQAQKISKNSEFIMYSIPQKKQKDYSHEEFIELNFFPFIKVHYLYYDKINFLSNQPNHNGHLANENLNNNQLANIITESDLLHPLVSQMAQYQKFIILGTTAGEVLFINSDFFCSSHKKNTKSTAICKYFKLFSTPVTRISIQNDRLFVSSSKNSSILNIKIVHNESLGISNQLKDEFNETISEEYLQKLVKTIYPKRQYIYESRLNFSENDHLDHPNKENQSQNHENQNDDQQMEENQQHQELPKNHKQKIHLELYSAIGRNAIYKRNNIFVDLRQNIISHTGCNLLILKKNQTKTLPQNYISLPPSNTNTPTNNFLTQQKVLIEEPSKRNNYHQQFLKLDVSPFSTFAQISCIAMSQDRRVILAGTNEENAKILFWDISTKTNLKQISLKSMISIRKLGISPSNQRITVIALNKKGQSILFFIQVTEQNILAAYSFSSEHQSINDIKFFPHSEFSFILCGNNYMAEWKYNGILTFEHYNIENPSDFIQIGDKNINSNQNNPKKNQSQVIFYSISFLKNILISAGSDGYLYIWNDKKIIKKQNAHPKSAILCLYASSSSKIFASGGADGKAIVWQLSSSSIIQKMFEFSIYHGREQKIPVRYHIQSVCISKNNIIVGTRAGEIYEFMCNDIEEIEKMKEEWKKGVNLILPAYDDDVINSISFNTSSQKLFMITQMGYFSVFDIETLQKIKQEKIDIGKSDIIKMIACKLSYRIIIVLKNSVLIYYYLHSNEEKLQKFRKGKQNFKSENNSFIKNAIMSSNQKYLALLIASAQMDLYSIQLYDLTQVEGSFFKESKILDHIPTNVQVIDFSTDNEYLICKNTEDQQTIVHLSTHETINPNSIEFQLEYSDQAKKTSTNIRDILQLYGQENQLLKIAQVMNHSIIATDEMGSIRVFEYPIVGGNNVKDKMDVSYYRFYVEHLNEVYLCVLSQDCRILATVGRQDRTIFLWKVKQV